MNEAVIVTDREIVRPQWSQPEIMRYSDGVSPVSNDNEVESFFTASVGRGTPPVRGRLGRGRGWFKAHLTDRLSVLPQAIQSEIVRYFEGVDGFVHVSNDLVDITECALSQSIKLLAV